MYKCKIVKKYVSLNKCIYKKQYTIYNVQYVSNTKEFATCLYTM